MISQIHNFALKWRTNCLLNIMYTKSLYNIHVIILKLILNRLHILYYVYYVTNIPTNAVSYYYKSYVWTNRFFPFQSDYAWAYTCLILLKIYEFHSPWIVIVYKNVCCIKNNGVWDISIRIKASERCVRLYTSDVHFALFWNFRVAVRWKFQ